MMRRAGRTTEPWFSANFPVITRRLRVEHNHTWLELTS